MDLPIAEVMERRVVAVDMDDTVEKVQALMEREHLSSVPVADAEGKCFGVISLVDLRHFHAQKRRPAAQRAWEICSHRVIEVAPTEPVKSVAAKMVSNRVHHVVVCEAGRHVGLVSSYDLLAKYLVDQHRVR